MKFGSRSVAVPMKTRRLLSQHRVAQSQCVAWALGRARRQAIMYGWVVSLVITGLLSAAELSALQARPDADLRMAILLGIILGPGVGVATGLGTWLRLRGRPRLSKPSPWAGCSCSAAWASSPSTR